MKIPFVFLGALACTAYGAETTYPIPTADAQVSVSLSTPLTIAPRFGFFPLRILIDNRSAQNGRWDLRLHSGPRDRFPGTVDTAVTIEVDAGQNKETWVYIPLASPGVSISPSVSTSSLTTSAMSSLIGASSSPIAISPSGFVVTSVSGSGVTYSSVGSAASAAAGTLNSAQLNAQVAQISAQVNAGLITAAEGGARVSALVSSGGRIAITAGGPGGRAVGPPPGAAPVSASAVGATARKLMNSTDLLKVPASVKQTQTTVPVPDSSGYYSYALVLLEQTGPVSELPRPAAGTIPDELVVNLHASDLPGMVTRTITYMDPDELERLSGATQGLSRERALAELMRYGYLRDQPGIDVGPMTVANNLQRASLLSAVISNYSIAETGPRNLLPFPAAASLPPGVGVQIVPVPGSASDVMRYFFVGDASILGQPKATPRATTVPASVPAAISSLISNAPPPTMVSAIDPSNITAEIDGYALASGQQINLSAPLVNGALPTPPVAVVPRMESQLRVQIIAGTRGSPTISPMDPFTLPADWRVWSSFHAVVMRARDFSDLDPARVSALKQWVSMGGLLLLSAGRDDGGPESTRNFGAGSIITTGIGLAETDSYYLVTKLQLNFLSLSLPPRDSMRFFSSSPLAGLVSENAVDSRMLATFLGLFGLLIGPVNLFVFARSRKRHRLFVTTPILALCGAVVMIGIIVHDDGFGGDGVRATVVSLIPGEPMAAVFQDQVAKTGFLTSRNFPLDDSTVIVGIPLAEYDPAGRDSNLLRQSGVANGDWFRNRWRQGHHLRALIPTRARIDIVGTATDGAPIVESTLTTELKDFIYVDADDRIWKLASILPGRRVPLEATDMQLRPLISAGGTRNLDALLNASALREPGRWFASGGPSDFAPIATLPSVRWTDSTIMYTGVSLPAAPAAVAPKKEGDGNG